MTIYVLTCILISRNLFMQSTIDLTIDVFTNAEDCFKTLEVNKPGFEKKYSYVQMDCHPRKIQ